MEALRSDIAAGLEGLSERVALRDAALEDSERDSERAAAAAAVLEPVAEKLSAAILEVQSSAAALREATAAAAEVSARDGERATAAAAPEWLAAAVAELRAAADAGAAAAASAATAAVAAAQSLARDSAAAGSAPIGDGVEERALVEALKASIGEQWVELLPGTGNLFHNQPKAESSIKKM